MSHAHLASVRIDAPLAFAFAQLTDIAAMGRWALGSMDFQPTATARVHVGTSLFDGARTFVEIRANEDAGLIDYLVGTEKERLPRISIRLTEGTHWGEPKDTCLAAMSTWRAAWMDDARWARTCTTHETEVLLFRAQIETAWAAK